MKREKHMKEATQDRTESVVFVEGVVEGIRKHSQRQVRLNGSESVGFMAGSVDDSRVTAIMPLNNHSSDPQRGFFVEPWEQFRAEKTLDAKGYRVVGVYHSHPTGEALPSRADRQLARAGELMAIYSVTFDELRVWREKDGNLIPVGWVETA